MASQLNGNDLGLLKILEGKIQAMRDLVDERDRLYKERDEFRRVSVDAALTAAKERVDAAFEASEKAIVKAESAQKAYNERSNEFRGQLDDQATRLITRTETLGLVGGNRNEMLGMMKNLEEKIVSIVEDVRQLRESRAMSGSSKEASRQTLSDSRAWVSLVVAVVGLTLAIIMFLIGRAT